MHRAKIRNLCFSPLPHLPHNSLGQLMTVQTATALFARVQLLYFVLQPFTMRKPDTFYLSPLLITRYARTPLPKKCLKCRFADTIYISCTPRMYQVRQATLQLHIIYYLALFAHATSSSRSYTPPLHERKQHYLSIHLYSCYIFSANSGPEYFIAL